MVRSGNPLRKKRIKSIFGVFLLEMEGFVIGIHK